MQSEGVIAVFDIGKTNKKLFLFDEYYQVVLEKTVRFDEVMDEDGEPCESIGNLQQFVGQTLQDVIRSGEFDVKAVNFSTYGASLVYINEAGKILTPLYNYLKPYPAELKEQFYSTYGAEEAIAMQTASPALGSLNSGLQFYRFKHRQPATFSKARYALHLPQYLSFLLTGKAFADMTSIGCHTAIWDYTLCDYHSWIKAERLDTKFAPVADSNTTIPVNFEGHPLNIGIGLHDSSAALVPYLVSFAEPFVLLSTGTWSITLNPFDHTPLTAFELQNDCLNYIQYKGVSVKASRLFAGHEYEKQVQRIAAYFGHKPDIYHDIMYDEEILQNITKYQRFSGSINMAFGQRNLSDFADHIEAYYQLIVDIVDAQQFSASLVMKGGQAKRIFVDGGFSKNTIFMHLLANAFPDMEIYAASMAQGTAIGAALAIHDSWNTKPIPTHLIDLKYYSAKHR